METLQYFNLHGSSGSVVSRAASFGRVQKNKKCLLLNAFSFFYVNKKT